MKKETFSIYDVGARLYTFPTAHTKDTFFSLVRELTDIYPTSKFEQERFSFMASKEQMCEIGTDYIQIVEPALDNGGGAIERVTGIARRVYDVLGISTLEALDVTVSGLLDVEKLGGRSDVIYFSGHEFLESYLFGHVDVSNLGIDGELEGLGFQLAFRRGDDKYSVRISPFEKEKRFLLLDLQLAYKEQEYEVAEIRQRGKEGIQFLEKEVVPFLESIARLRSAGK